MRVLAPFSVVSLAVALVVATACGSDDERVVDRSKAGEGGRGLGEAGVGQVLPQGGTSTAGSGGAGEGGVPMDGSAGFGGAGAVNGEPEPGGAGGVSAGAGGLGVGGESGQAGAGGASSTTVLDLDFDAALPANLDPGTASLTPSQGFADLGPEGNKFGNNFLRGPTGTVMTLTLTDLPAHTTLSLSLLFAAIDSLDGTGTFPSGDFFKITLDGEVVFRESFANAIESQIQSYEPPPAAVLARRVDLGFSGPGGYYTDSAYDFGQDPRFQNLPHSASSAVLVFTLEGEGVQDVDDESWAIDNLRVTVE